VAEWEVKSSTRPRRLRLLVATGTLSVTACSYVTNWHSSGWFSNTNCSSQALIITWKDDSASERRGEQTFPQQAAGSTLNPSRKPSEVTNAAPTANAVPASTDCVPENEQGEGTTRSDWSRTEHKLETAAKEHQGDRNSAVEPTSAFLLSISLFLIVSRHTMKPGCSTPIFCTAGFALSAPLVAIAASCASPWASDVCASP
jgi:hypothetical protein